MWRHFACSFVIALLVSQSVLAQQQTAATASAKKAEATTAKGLSTAARTAASQAQSASMITNWLTQSQYMAYQMGPGANMQQAYQLMALGQSKGGSAEFSWRDGESQSMAGDMGLMMGDMSFGMGDFQGAYNAYSSAKDGFLNATSFYDAAKTKYDQAVVLYGNVKLFFKSEADAKKAAADAAAQANQLKEGSATAMNDAAYAQSQPAHDAWNQWAFFSGGPEGLNAAIYATIKNTLDQAELELLSGTMRITSADAQTTFAGSKMFEGTFAYMDEAYGSAFASYSYAEINYLQAKDKYELSFWDFLNAKNGYDAVIALVNAN